MARARAGTTHQPSLGGSAARHRAARGRGATLERKRSQDARVLALFAVIGAVALAGLVLLLRQDPNAAVPPSSVPSVAAPQAAQPAQPAQQIDWKLKGAPAAPVLVEEWGDFQ